MNIVVAGRCPTNERIDIHKQAIHRTSIGVVHIIYNQIMHVWRNGKRFAYALAVFNRI